MIEEIRRIYEATRMTVTQAPDSGDVVWPANWVRIFYKTYPRFSRRPCLADIESGLCKLLERRRSMRAFGADALPCHLLDEILSYSAGRVRIESDSERRYYPSAGGRYPIELYFVSNNVDSLEPGLYHYSAKDNSLEVLWHKDLSTDCARIFGADFDSTVVNYVVLTGVMSRAEVKYGINAYRFALIECGHLCQNICLLATERDRWL